VAELLRRDMQELSKATPEELVEGAD